MLLGLPAEQRTRPKDKDAAKEIKRVRMRAPPSCWLAASFPLFFYFLLRLFSSPSSASACFCLHLPLLPSSYVSSSSFLLEALASLYRVLG
ncbi:hypothetical protein ACLB2K_049903 [Fragaria x ananassa]